MSALNGYKVHDRVVVSAGDEEYWLVNIKEILPGDKILAKYDDGSTCPFCAECIVGYGVDTQCVEPIPSTKLTEVLVA